MYRVVKTAVPLALLGTLLALVPGAHASDLAQEESWAEQIVESLEDQNAYWLDAGDSEFIALYTPALGRRRAAVLILHDAGTHPDWREVVRPLRTQLAARGFDTLAIQMPVPPRDAAPAQYRPLYDEAVDRILAGLETLLEEGNQRVFLIGHGLGAAMGVYYLDAAGSPEIAGAVWIGMVATGAPDGFGAAAVLARARLPVLDLWGAADSEVVRRAAAARAVAAKTNRRYAQQAIPGAGHDFAEKERELVGAVSAWLDREVQPVKRGK
jgi:alpha-beta hydrolase superfamily lysophospholipase